MGKPETWKSMECLRKRLNLQDPEEATRPDCEGVMELKDVTLSIGSLEMRSEGGRTFPVYKRPILEKTWVCNKCGFVFYE